MCDTVCKTPNFVFFKPRCTGAQETKEKRNKRTSQHLQLGLEGLVQSSSELTDSTDMPDDQLSEAMAGTPQENTDSPSHADVNHQDISFSGASTMRRLLF